MPPQRLEQDAISPVLNDITIAVMTLEVITATEDCPADLREFAQTALLRLLNAATALRNLAQCGE